MTETARNEKDQDNFWLYAALGTGLAGIVSMIGTSLADHAKTALEEEQLKRSQEKINPLRHHDAQYLDELIEATALLLQARDQERPQAKRQLLLEQLEPRQGGFDR